MTNKKNYSDSDLIELVRQKPILFDKNHKSYLNNILKSRIWKEVAKRAGFENGDKARKRWTRLCRTYKYNKEKSSTGNGFDDVQEVWPLYESMHFLDKPLEQRDGQRQYDFVKILKIRFVCKNAGWEMGP